MNPRGSHASSLRCFVDSIRLLIWLTILLRDQLQLRDPSQGFGLKIRLAAQVPPRWRGAAKLAVDKWKGPFAHAGYKQAIRGVLPTDPDWPEDYEARSAPTVFSFEIPRVP